MMSIIEDYESSDDEYVPGADQRGKEEAMKKKDIDVASISKIAQRNINLKPAGVLDPGANSVRMYDEANSLPTNIKADSLWAPTAGPTNPDVSYAMHVERVGDSEGDEVVVKESSIPLPKDGSSGYSEKTAINELTFEEQYFKNRKRKGNSNTTTTVGTQENDSKDAEDDTATKKKRLGSGDPGEGYLGPWAGWEGDRIEKQELTMGQLVYLKGRERVDRRASARRDAKEQEKLGKTIAETEEGKQAEVVVDKKTEKSIFYGGERFDYQGRSFLTAPSTLKNKPHTCYIPKKCVHTWTGHTKPVSCAHFFPKTGHYILSCSMDGTARLWRVPDKETSYNGDCVYEYQGHSAGIKDASFSRDGTRFITASFDRTVKLWDAEYGKCITRFRNKGAIPYCCKMNPDQRKQQHILAGYSDNKIVQFDVRTSRVAQIYNQHLSSVNTITFCENNRRFMSSSDDKTLRVWEYGIPEQIKYIADPSMNSIPAITLHPDKKHFLCQSLDNNIVVYEAFGRYKLSKKRFSGHLVAGYACRVTASPDSKFIASGDSSGSIWFWDWKSGKCYMNQKISNAHGNSIVIATEWHPIYPSKLASCGWDGTIKLWG